MVHILGETATDFLEVNGKRFDLSESMLWRIRNYRTRLNVEVELNTDGHICVEVSVYSGTCASTDFLADLTLKEENMWEADDE